MVQPIEPVQHRHPHLLLHCGASAVELKQVARVKTPRPTVTWTPIPHIELIHQVEQTLGAAQLKVGSQAHSLTHDGLRYFGLMEIKSSEVERDDYCLVLGLRNSHDKTFPAGIITGASVFVCDNLSFSGEIKLTRKHTRLIIRDMPLLVGRAIGLLTAKWHQQDTRITDYKATDVDDRTAHDLIIRSTDAGVCSNRLIPQVLQDWRRPRHEAFEERTVWSLFNAFTEALKTTGNLAELPKRTHALHALLDAHVGLTNTA